MTIQSNETWNGKRQMPPGRAGYAGHSLRIWIENFSISISFVLSKKSNFTSSEYRGQPWHFPTLGMSWKKRGNFQNWRRAALASVSTWCLRQCISAGGVGSQGTVSIFNFTNPTKLKMWLQRVFTQRPQIKS